MLTRSKNGISKPKIDHIVFVSIVPSNVESDSFKEDSKYIVWWDSMKEDYEALLINNTWELILQTEVERYKSYVETLRYHQDKEIDYFEIFNLVVKHTTVISLLSLAHSKGWVMRQLV